MTNENKSENELESANGLTWNQLAKYFAGESTDEEQSQIRHWLDGEPSREDLLETLRNVWVEGGKHPQQFDARSIWNKVAIRIRISDNRGEAQKLEIPVGRPRIWKDRPLRYSLGVFVTILLLVSVPFVAIKLIDRFNNPRQTEIRQISTKIGERAQFHFSDGSQIWLNSATTVRFPDPFARDRREIELEGEAYFDVVHSDGQPFIVKATNAVVQDLGTQFNVRAWKEDKTVDVVVATGSVLFQHDSAANIQNVVVKRGERSVLTEDGQILPPQKVDVLKYLNWMKGVLIFDRTPMINVIKQLEHRYGVHFRLANPSIGAFEFTGSFQRESFDEVLKTISMTTNLKYSTSGREVMFSQR